MQARMQPVIQYIPRLLLAPVSPLKNRISHSGILNIFLPVRGGVASQSGRWLAYLYFEYCLSAQRKKRGPTLEGPIGNSGKAKEARARSLCLLKATLLSQKKEKYKFQKFISSLFEIFLEIAGAGILISFSIGFGGLTHSVGSP